jgi:Mg/Co/Ni transporter MgtE
VKDFVRDDVVTAALDERVGPIRERIEASPYGFGFVVAADRTLLGRLRYSHLWGEPDATAEAVMEPGPTTVRLDTGADELAQRLRDRDLKTAVTTDPEGKLEGIVLLADLA